jgi:PadR family transcriptional regulator, regulatory protein PadR
MLAEKASCFPEEVFPLACLFHPISAIVYLETACRRDMAKNPEHRDLFSGALEMMILQSLRLKPMHGYALTKHIKQVSDNLLQIEEGSLYPALQRMLKEGWLESEVGVSAKNRPIRIYRLTDAGIQHLEQEVSSFEKMFAGISRVLAVAQS